MHTFTYEYLYTEKAERPINRVRKLDNEESKILFKFIVVIISPFPPQQSFPLYSLPFFSAGGGSTGYAPTLAYKSL